MATVSHLREEDQMPGSNQQIHKVGVPPRQNLFKEFKATVKETLFADDPFRPFKDQTRSRKLVLGVQAIFPIVEWGRKYDLRKFRGDLIAGLTIASLCIPQVIIILKKEEEKTFFLLKTNEISSLISNGWILSNE